MLLTERLTTAGRLAAGRGPRAEQSAGHHRGLRGGAAGARARSATSPVSTPSRTSRAISSSSRRRRTAARRSPEACSTSCAIPEAAARPTDVNVLVERRWSSRATSPLRREPARHRSRPRAAAVVANEGQLRQVFLGLAGNALEAMDGRGTLTVTTRRRGDRGGGDRLRGRGPGHSRRTSCRACSIPSSPPSRRARAPASASPSRRASWSITAAASRSTPAPGAGATFRVILPVGLHSLRRLTMTAHPRPRRRRREEPSRAPRPRAARARATLVDGVADGQAALERLKDDAARRAPARHEDAPRRGHRGAAARCRSSRRRRRSS